MNEIPQHVAVIMDGNGRWASRQGKPRVFGHQAGAERVEEIMKACQEIGVKYVTFYSFSKENWQRPKDEVGFLMQLLSFFLDSKLNEIKKANIVFNVIGRIDDMPEEVRRKIERNMTETRHNTGLVATFAFSYSGRSEITEACRAIARKARAGELDPESITEATISANLDTRDIPDPELLVRTSGEMRISNFLLWQISYTELYVTDKCWPEFTREEFIKAMRGYQARERRFGLVEPPQR